MSGRILPKKPSQANNIIQKEIKLLDGPAAKIEANAPKPPQFLTTPLTRVENTTLGTKEEIKTMVNAAKDHVLKGSSPRYKKSKGVFKFSGTHTKSGLEQMIKENGGGKYVLKDLKINPSTGVYECRPEIHFTDGRVATKDGNEGLSSFFPNSWSKEKLDMEVQYASNHIIGKLSKWKDRYVGISSDGKVRIVIQYREYLENGEVVKKITSFYPIYE